MDTIHGRVYAPPIVAVVSLLAFALGSALAHPTLILWWSLLSQRLERCKSLCTTLGFPVSLASSVERGVNNTNVGGQGDSRLCSIASMVMANSYRLEVFLLLRKHACISK